MLVHLPQHAQDPAGFCARTELLQRVAGEDVPVPGPPVLWLSPRAAQQGHPLPYAPLWWADGWRDFGPLPAATHAQAHLSYVPRRFEPPWRCGSVLLRAADASLEAGPSSRVVQLLKVLLCEVDGNLWSKPATGGEWRECPFNLDFQLARTEAFEVMGGQRYVFFFRSMGSAGGGSDSVLIYHVGRNEWTLPSSSRPTASAHQGEVRWETLRGPKPSPAPLKAWLLEANLDYIVLLAPVASDGMQRDKQDDHAVVHFLDCDGQVVSHHLPCSIGRLSVQRYSNYMLFVKADEVGKESNSSVLHEEKTAGWLWAVSDVAVPPLPVMLPDGPEWSHRAWSMVLARGLAQEFSAAPNLQLDTAPRLYLLEEEPSIRLWASRRVDDILETLHQQHSLDGSRFFRHVLSFSPVPGSELLVEASSNGEDASSGTWLLWSPDLQHSARVLPAEANRKGKLGFWRCSVTFSDPLVLMQSSQPTALRSFAVDSVEPHYVDSRPMGFKGWLGGGLPAEDARVGPVTGQPCFPTWVRNEGNFDRPDDYWLHPLGQGVMQLPPMSSLR
mmetsp:Transcript_64618/g.114941  ORF Transcript_64618/g.114941 Transcript_64618/m.114941 type:complete len:556 (-) Transcript_64618:113-1780(-)